MAIWVTTDLNEGGLIHYEALSVEYYGKVPNWTIISFCPRQWVWMGVMSLPWAETNNCSVRHFAIIFDTEGLIMDQTTFIEVRGDSYGHIQEF